MSEIPVSCWKYLTEIEMYMCTRLKLKRKKILVLTLLHSERPKLYTILAFMSAIGLKNICLLGGGGHHGTLPKAQSSVNIQALAGIIKGKSLIEMATRGEDGVTIDGAIKLVKFAFCFEQWEVFEALNDAVLHYLRVCMV